MLVRESPAHILYEWVNEWVNGFVWIIVQHVNKFILDSQPSPRFRGWKETAFSRIPQKTLFHDILWRLDTREEPINSFVWIRIKLEIQDIFSFYLTLWDEGVSQHFCWLLREKFMDDVWGRDIYDSVNLMQIQIIILMQLIFIVIS